MENLCRNGKPKLTVCLAHQYSLGQKVSYTDVLSTWLSLFSCYAGKKQYKVDQETSKLAHEKIWLGDFGQ